VAPFKILRVVERPGQPPGHARKDRTLLLDGFLADGDDVIIQPAFLVENEHVLGPLSRQVEADLFHGLDDQRVDAGRLKTGAFRHIPIAGQVIEERLCHLASAAVVDANEKDLCLFRWVTAHVFTSIPVRAVSGPQSKKGICHAFDFERLYVLGPCQVGSPSRAIMGPQLLERC
jgi:hypothetical protein